MMRFRRSRPCPSSSPVWPPPTLFPEAEVSRPTPLSLAAALGEMVAGLTEGKKKYLSVEERVREIHQQLGEIRSALHRLVQEDSEAYLRVMAALKLPKDER